MWRCANINQQKGAGAIRAFSHALTKARLTKQSCLLIPKHPGNWCLEADNAFFVVPKLELDGTTCGIMFRGIRSFCRSSSSQAHDFKLNSNVREALLGSVQCDLPPVKFQINQVSIVPKSNLPASANWRACGT